MLVLGVQSCLKTFFLQGGTLGAEVILFFVSEINPNQLRAVAEDREILAQCRLRVL